MIIPIQYRSLLRSVINRDKNNRLHREMNCRTHGTLYRIMHNMKHSKKWTYQYLSEGMSNIIVVSMGKGLFAIFRSKDRFGYNISLRSRHCIVNTYYDFDGFYSIWNYSHFMSTILLDRISPSGPITRSRSAIYNI
jgi:hypothetical protein